MARRKQCKACPWKVSTNPDRDIPGGYCRQKHRNLRSTIAEPGALRVGSALRLMACHETTGGAELPCVGWLAHQLGPGNNIALRLAASRDKSLCAFELDGEQHARFEDTLPAESL
jgi:hypothetical protein